MNSNVLKNYKIKELIHPLLMKVLTSKVTGELKVEGSLPEEGNYLIVANHMCIEDIPTLAQALNKHFYLLVSDEDKGTIDGLGLELNGVIWVHRTDKESRQNASKDIVEVLKNGKNFAMYPEATWNLSPNLLILPMNYGCIRIALEANVPIVPVVSFFDSDSRHTIIGEKFYPSNDLTTSISDLRDVMATMVFNEIEQRYKNNKENSNIYSDIIDGVEYYYEKREDIDRDYWEEYFNNLYNSYGRAKNDKSGVREFESSFIFTLNNDSYNYFQLFNSSIKYIDGKMIIKRISSEFNGYNDSEYKENFGYGYNEKVLKKERFTINELQERLRGNNIVNIGDVEYAILETNGEVTVIQKPNKRNSIPDFNIMPDYEGIPYDLVIDGVIMEENLKKIGKNYIWLERQVEKFNMKPKDALVVTLDGKGQIFCQKKEEKGN